MSNIHVRQILKILVSAGLVGYCLTLVDMRAVLAALVGIRWTFFVPAFLCTLLGTIVFKALITWRLLSQKNGIQFTRLLMINLSLRFYSMVLPKAVVTGIRWNKYCHISSKELSLVLVTFEALFALAVAALATLVFIYLDGSAVIPSEFKLVTIAFSLLFVGLVCFLFVFPESNSMSMLNKFIVRYKNLNICAKLFAKWRHAATQLQLSRFNNLWPVVAFGLAGHLLFVTGGYLLFLALSIDIHFTTVAWIRSAVFILVSVPISFAGIGIRELGLVALFGLYGMSPDSIMAYAMLAFLVQSVIGLVGMTTELKGWFTDRSGVKY